MKEMDKIIEEAERATRIEYDLLSGRDPLDRHLIFRERLHGMHIALLAASFILYEKEDYHSTGEKIAEMIRKLSEESSETLRKARPDLEEQELL